MIRRPPRSTPLYSSAASDVYKRQFQVFLTLSSLSHCATNSHAPNISATHPKPSRAPENRVPIFRVGSPFSRGSTSGQSARAVARSRSTKKLSSSRPPSQFTSIGTKPGSGQTPPAGGAASCGGSGGGSCGWRAVAKPVQFIHSFLFYSIHSFLFNSFIHE